MLAAVIDPFIDVAAVRDQVRRGTNDKVDVQDATQPNPAILEQADVLVTAEVKVTGAVLKLAPHAHTVVTASTGVDHLAIDELDVAGVAVRSIEGYCTNEVADHALACVLSHLRQLPALWEAVRSGDWPATGLRGITRVSSARLGIIGLGRIGRAVVDRASLLGMSVEPYSQHSSNAQSRDEVNAHLRMLAERVDVLVICAAGDTDRGGPLVDSAVIDALRADSAVVNIARASLIDTKHLCSALRRGDLGAAYLDVWPQEPPAVGDPLLETPNLYLTPHVGWFSPDSRSELWRRVAVEICNACQQ